MSKFLSNLEVKKFETEVHHQFRTVAGDIKELARTRMIDGKKTQFPVFGYSKMQQHVRGQQIKPANGSRTPVEVAVTAYDIGDYTDIFDDANVNFSERQEFVKTIADAMKNQSLQILIDALNASSTTKTIADTISGSASNMTVDAVIEAGKLLDDDGVPNDGGRILKLSSSGVHSLLKDPKVTSMDYVTRQALMTGRLDDFYGFKVRMIGANMKEGGLPVPSSNHRTSFAYHKNAVGVAINVNQKIDVQWHNDYGEWFVAGFLSAGAAAIDDLGIVKITTDESA